MIISQRTRALSHLVVFLVVLFPASCSRPEPPRKKEPATPEVTNQIALPPEVIANVGITFERTRRGSLDQWIRVPGFLDAPDDRRWIVRAPAEGRVQLGVRVGDRVTAGGTLGSLDSAALAAAQSAIVLANARATNAQKQFRSGTDRLEESERLVAQILQLEGELEKRRDRLKKAAAREPGDSPALSSRELLEAEQALVDARTRSLEASIRRDQLEKQSRELRMELERTRLELDQRLLGLAVLTGSTREQLTASTDGKPRWQSLNSLAIRAPGAGVVIEVAVAAGDHVAPGTSLLTVADASTLVFRGYAPESDLDRLTPGALVRLKSSGSAPAIETHLWNAPPSFDRESRSILVRAWVPNADLRLPPGLSATAQVRIARGAREEVLLASDCVVFDGLEAIVFRRDPDDPGSVTRTPVELGKRAAGEVEILAGLMDGDEVVRDGAHQLKQTGQGRTPEGGHFHADGTWHEEEH